MGSSINSVSRRLGTPISIKLHQSFYMPIPKEIRSLLDLWGWSCSTPSACRNRQLSSYFSVKRNLFFLQTLRSWVTSRGNLFIRMRVSDNYASVGIHLYVFGGSFAKKKPSQFRSGCLAFDTNLARFESNLIFSTLYIEKSLECLYSDLFRSQVLVVVTIHNLFFLIIGNYFNFVSELSASLVVGYAGRLTIKQFSLGVNLIVCLFNFPYPILLSEWVAVSMEQDKRSGTCIIGFVKEALSYFDEFERKLRGVSLAVKGRVGGSDKSLKHAVRWGKIPRETLRAAVITSFRAAFTSQGVIGVRVGLYFI